MVLGSKHRSMGPLALGCGQSFRFSLIFTPLQRKQIANLLRKLPKNIGLFCLNFFKTCPNLPPNSVLTQKLWQNSSYLQLGRMYNCFYAFTTIFAQQFNICSLATRLVTVVMWFLSFCCNRKPIDNSHCLPKKTQPACPHFRWTMSQLF